MTKPRPYPEFNHELKETEYKLLPPETTIDDLIQRLGEYEIPLDEYGVDGAKTVHHLLEEVKSGESVLKVGGNRVQRLVDILWLDVLHQSADGEVYILKEDRQVFKDGSIKFAELESSIGKKIIPTDDLEGAAARALNKVLSIENADNISRIGDKERSFKPSIYPGISTTYNMHSCVATIPETEFNPDGYVEHLAEKEVYYKWELLNTPQVVAES